MHAFLPQIGLYVRGKPPPVFPQILAKIMTRARIVRCFGRKQAGQIFRLDQPQGHHPFALFLEKGCQFRQSFLQLRSPVCSIRFNLVNAGAAFL